MARRQKCGPASLRSKKQTEEQCQRKSLQTLQQSSQSPQILVSSSGSRVLRGSKKEHRHMQDVTKKNMNSQSVDKDTSNLTYKENSPYVVPQQLQQKSKVLNKSNQTVTKRLLSQRSKVLKKADSLNCETSDIEACEDITNDNTKEGEDELMCLFSSEGSNSGFTLMDADYLITNVPASYWKDLAEERRIALEKALKENESLHNQVEAIREDNKKLLAIVNVAEKLSAALQEKLES